MELDLYGFDSEVQTFIFLASILIFMLAKIVFRNILYNSSSVLLANVVGVIVTIYVARVLKPELFGIYSLTLSIAFLLLTFTDLGINATVVRYVADAHSLKDYELVRGYIESLAKLKVLLALAVSAGLFLLSDVVSVIFHKPLSTPLKIMSPFVFFFSLAGFVNSVFNAFNDFKSNLIRSLVYEFSRLFLIISFVSIGLSVIGALLGFTISTILAFLTLLTLLIKNYGYILSGKAKSVNWRRVLRFTGYLTIGSISWVVFAYVDSIMIGMFLPAEYVGYYRAAYNIVGAISGLVSIPVVLFPVFVQLEGKDLKNAFNRAFKYSAIISFPITFGLPVISEPLIKFIYGIEYLPAVSVMWFLSLLILRSSLGFWAPIFNAKEKPEYPVYVSFVSMTLNIVLNYFMILRFGIVGASIATVVANGISWAILGYLSSKMFEIFPKREHIIRPLVASLLTCYLLSNFELHSLFEGVVAITAGAVIYLAALFAFRGLTKDDFEYIKIILRDVFFL